MSLLLLLGLAIMGLLAGFVVWMQLVRQVAAPQIRARVAALRSSVPFGARVDVAVTLENPSPVPCPLVQCQLLLPPGLDLPAREAKILSGGKMDEGFGQKQVLFAVALGAREVVTVHVGLDASLRGRHPLQLLTLHVSDGFTMSRQELSFPLRNTITIHPRRLTTGRRRLPRHLVGSLASLRKLTPTGIDWVDLREYQPGDSIRDIAWMTSARRGELIVLERDTTMHQRLVVVTSVRVSSMYWEAYSAHADRIYEAAQAIVEDGLRQGAECLVYADGYWGEGRGRPNRHLVLQADGGWTPHIRQELGHVLGSLSAHAAVPLPRILAEVARDLAHPSRIVVLAGFDDAATQAGLARLRGQGHQVWVTAPELAVAAVQETR